MNIQETMNNLQTLYNATRQLQVGADAHEQLKKITEQILEHLQQLSKWANSQKTSAWESDQTDSLKQQKK